MSFCGVDPAGYRHSLRFVGGKKGMTVARCPNPGRKHLPFTEFVGPPAIPVFALEEEEKEKEKKKEKKKEWRRWEWERERGNFVHRDEWKTFRRKGKPRELMGVFASPSPEQKEKE